MSRILNYMIELSPYLIVTFHYVIISLVFGSILGFALATAKLGKIRLLKQLAIGYTTIMRCTPSIVLLFIVFYGLPILLRSSFQINIDGWKNIVFVEITFSLFLGASLSEVMRSAYGAIDQGQYEAAVSVGLSGFQAFFTILLPQAFAVSIPNIGNTILYLLKEGALGYTIGLIDVMGKAYLINGFEMGAHVLQVYFALSCIYWLLSIGIEKLFQLLESRFAFNKEKAPVKA